MSADEDDYDDDIEPDEEEEETDYSRAAKCSHDEIVERKFDMVRIGPNIEDRVYECTDCTTPFHLVGRPLWPDPEWDRWMTANMTTIKECLSTGECHSHWLVPIPDLMKAARGL